MIYFSTGGMKGCPAHKTSKMLYEMGINFIELSGGEYCKDNLKKLKNLKNEVKFKVHNYFPPPNKPFVFNLCSPSKEIAKKSLDLAKKGINYAYELNSTSYSFHAGFLIDPDINEIGKRVQKKTLYNRQDSINIFIDRVNILSSYAKYSGVELMIENNVLSHNNYRTFNQNPFLMADSDEACYIMKNTPKNVNLLVDVAHLKVSYKSLSKKVEEFFKKTKKYIKAFHFSENDGFSDTNEPFNSESWFWEYLIKDLDYYSIEVYDYKKENVLQQYKLAKNFIKS